MKRSAFKARKRKTRMTAAQRAESQAWFETAMRAKGKGLPMKSVCAVGGAKHRDSLQIHHVIPKRILKVEGHADRLWDPRNSLVLCSSCHARHESALRKVPLALLRPAHFEFAEELGLLWVLDRFYAAD